MPKKDSSERLKLRSAPNTLVLRVEAADYKSGGGFNLLISNRGRKI